MDTRFVAPLALLAAALWLPTACTSRDEDAASSPPDCDDAWADSVADARASIDSCTCRYEETWDVGAYDDPALRGCYGQGFAYVYDYECWEPCVPSGDDTDHCCYQGMMFVADQR